jgi:hypothetical protein
VVEDLHLHPFGQGEKLKRGTFLPFDRLVVDGAEAVVKKIFGVFFSWLFSLLAA